MLEIDIFDQIVSFKIIIALLTYVNFNNVDLTSASCDEVNRNLVDYCLTLMNLKFKVKIIYMFVEF